MRRTRPPTPDDALISQTPEATFDRAVRVIPSVTCIILGWISPSPSSYPYTYSPSYESTYGVLDNGDPTALIASWGTIRQCGREGASSCSEPRAIKDASSLAHAYSQSLNEAGCLQSQPPAVFERIPIPRHEVERIALYRFAEAGLAAKRARRRSL